METSTPDAQFRDSEAALERAGRIEDLIRLYESRAREFPGNGESSRLLSKAGELAWDRLRNFTRAEELLRRAHLVSPSEKTPLLALKALYEQKQDASGLADTLERLAAASRGPEAAALYLRAADLYEQKLNRRDRAFLCFQLSTRSDPHSREAWDRIRKILLSELKLLPAFECLERQRSVLGDESLADGYAQIAEAAIDDPEMHPLGARAAEVALSLDAHHERARAAKAAIASSGDTWRNRVRVLRQESLEERDRRRAAFLSLGVARLQAAFEPKAKQKLQDALDRCFLLWPAMPEAVALMVRLAAQHGELPKAEQALEKMAGAYRERSAQVDLWIQLGMLRLTRKGDGKGALAAFERATQIDASRADAVSLAAELYLEAGRAPDAVALYERHLSTLKDRSQQLGLRLRLARLCHQQLKDPPAARRHLEAALLADPHSPDAAYELSSLLVDTGDLDAVAPHLELALCAPRPPADLVSLCERVAASADRRGNAGLAYEALSRALSLDPMHPGLVEAACAAAKKANAELRFAEALKLAAQVAPPPTATVLWRNLASVLETPLARPAEAKAAWSEVLKLAPDDGQAMEALQALEQAELANDGPHRRARLEAEAKRLEVQGADPRAAADVYRKMLEQDPDDLTALKRMGAASAALEQWDDVATVTARLARLTPGREERNEWRARLAQVYSDRLGRREEAADLYLALLADGVRSQSVLNALEKLARAKVREAEISRALAPLYAESGDYPRQAASLLIQLSTSRDRNEQKALLAVLAQMHERHLMDSRAALSFWLRALSIDPDEAEFRREAVRVAREARAELEVSRVLVDVACRVTDARLASSLFVEAAELAEDAKSPEDAVRALQSALMSLPEDAEILTRLLKLLRSAGRLQECEQLLERRVSEADERVKAGLLVDLARLRAEMGKPAEAARALEDAVAAGAPEDEHLAALADLYAKAGRMPELSRALERQIELAQNAGEAEVVARLTLRRAQVLDAALGDRVAAVKNYSDILRQRPSDPDALAALEGLLDDPACGPAAARALVPAYEATQDFRKVVRALDRIVQTATSAEDQLVALRKAAEVYQLHLRQPEMAFAALARAVWLAPLDGRLRMAARMAADDADMLAEYADQLADRVAQAGADAALQAALHRELAELYDKKLQDRGRAIGHHRAVLAVDKGNLDALRALQRLHRSAGEWAALVDVLEQFANVVVDQTEKASAWREAAHIHEQKLEDLDSASAAWRRIAEMSPRDREAALSLDRIYSALGRAEDLAFALELRRAQEGHSPQAREATFRLAQLRQGALGDEQAALVLYRQILEQDPGHAGTREALDLWARSEAPLSASALEALDPVLARAGDHTRRVAIREARLDFALAEENSKLYLEIRRIAEHDLRQPKLAFSSALKAFAQGVDREVVQPELERLARVTNGWEEVAQTYHSITEGLSSGDPALAALLRRAAQIYEQLGQAEDATRVWKQLVDEVPQDREALEALGRLYEKAKNARKLSEVYAKQAQLATDPARRIELLLKAGIAQEGAGDDEEAVETFKSVLAIGASVEALEALDRLFGKLKRFDEQADVLDQLAQAAKQPKVKKGYLLRRAALLERAEAHPEAVNLYAEVLRLAAGEPAALEGLERLFSSEPVRLPVAALLEPIYREQRQTRKLADVLDVRLAQGADQDRLPLLQEIATLRESLGDKGLAFAARLRAFAENPEDATVRAELERMAAATSAFEELAAAYEDRIDRGASDALALELWRKLAGIYVERLGRLELAARALEEVTHRVPTDLGALEALAQIYRKTSAPRELADVMRRQIIAQPAVEEQVRLLFELGNLAEEQLHDLGGAAKCYAAILEREPTNADAFQMLAAVLQMSERWQDLAQLTEREIDVAMNRGAEEEALERMVRLGRIRVQRLEDAPGGLQVFREVLEKNLQHPGAITALEELARGESAVRGDAALALEPVFVASGDHLRLVQVLELRVAASATPEQRAELLRRMGDLYARHLESPEQAFIAAARALREVPDDGAALEQCLAYAAPADAEEALADLLEEAAGRAQTPEIRAVEYRALGEVKERQGDLAGAVDAFSAVLQIAENVEALQALDRLFGQMKRDEEQGEVLDRLAHLASDPEARKGYLLRRAALHERAGAEEQAVSLYAQVLEIAPSDGAAVAGLERLFTGEAVRARASALLEPIYRAAGDARKLADVLEVRLGLDGNVDRPAVVREIAALRESLGEKGLAFSARLRAFAEDPEDAAVRRELERLAASTGAFEELAAAYEDRIEQGGSEALVLELWRKLASIYGDRLGRLELAARAWEEVVRREPRDLSALDALAQLYRELNAPRELAEVMRRQIEAQPSVEEQVNLLFELGNLAEEQLQDLDVAASCYAAVLERRPADLNAIQLLGRVLEDAERWPDLAQLTEREIQLAAQAGSQEDALDLTVRLGRIRLARLGDAEGALGAFQQVLKANLQHAGAVAGLEEMARGESALRGEAARALEPVFTQSGDYLRLVQVLERRVSVEAAPETRADLLRRMAEIYAKRLESPEQAFITAARALRELPDDAAALELCLAHVEAADAEEALVEVLEDAATRASNPQVRAAEYRALGAAKEHQGDTVGAVDAFLSVLASGRDIPSLQALDRLYAALDQIGEQAEVLEQLAEATDEPQTRRGYLVRRAGLLERSRAYEEAVQLYAGVLEMAPGDAEAVEGLERLFNVEPVRAQVAALLEPVYRAVHDARKLADVLDVRLAYGGAENRLAVVQEIALLRESLGEKSVAFSARLRAFAENPDDPQVRTDLERLAAATGGFEELAAAYEDRIEQGASDEVVLELWRKLAAIYRDRLGRDELAARALEEVSRRAPDDLQALAALAELYRETQAPRELADVMRRQIQAQPSVDEQVNLLFELGNLAEEQLQDLDAAATCYAAILERKPTELNAVELLGRALEARERWPELAELTEREIALASQRGAEDEALELTVRLGRIRLEKLDDARGGLEAFQRVLERNSHHAGAVSALEEMARGEGPLRGDAARALEPVFTRSGDHLRLVQVLEWRVAAEEAPEWRAAMLRRMAEIYAAQLDSPEQAFITAARALRDAPDDAEALELCVAHAAPADAEDALIELLEEASERATVPQLRAAQFLALGNAKEHQADSAGAVDAFLAVLAIGPNRDALEALDRLFGKLGRHEEQADILNRLAEVATEPDVQRGYLARRAELLESAGAHETAVELYAKVLELGGGDAEAVAGLERLFSSEVVRGRVAALLEPIYRSLNDTRKLADVLDVLLGEDTGERRTALVQEIALLRESLGEKGLAFSARLRGFAESPEDPKVRAELERMAAATGAFEELAAAYEDRIEQGGSEPLVLELWRKLASIYLSRLGRLELAARALEEVAQRVPNDLQALDALARVYRKLGAYRELADVMRRQIHAQPSVDEQVNLLFELGNVAEENLQDLAIAAKCYAAILDRKPNDQNAFELLGRVLAASERWPELARLTQREIQLASERGAQEEALDLMVRLGRLQVQRLNDPRGGLETFQDVLKRKPRHAAAVAALEEMARSGSTLRGAAALALEPVFTADGDYLRLVTVLESRVSAETVPEERTLLLRRMAEIYAEHLDSPEQAFITAARALRDVPDDEAALKLCLAFAGPADADDGLLDLLEESSAAAQVPSARVAQFRALAQVRERHGDVAGAIDALKHVFEAVPEDGEAVDALIRLLSRENRAGELLEVLRRQLSILEDVNLRAERMFQIGVLQEEALEDPEGALAMFRWLLDLRPDEPRALARLETLCARLERWPELADVLAQRIKNASGAEALELTFRLGDVRENRLYDPTGALELYGQILAREPSHAGALGRLEAMVERDPHQLAASDVLLQAYRAHGDVSKLSLLLDSRAASAAEVADRKPFLLELAELQVDKLGEPELGFMSLLRAFRDDPNDPDVRLRLEKTAEAADAWDELSGVYEEELLRIAEAKDAAEVCVKLGEIFDQRLSQPERAVECFEKARALDEAVWLKALPSLDRLYNQLSRPENLAEVLEKLAELAAEPKAKIGYLFRLGQLAHEALETPERSVKAYEQILSLDPNHLATARLLEDLYEELGQAKQLYRILEHQRDRAQGPERERIFLKMAQISAESLEDADRSVQIYKDLLAKNPRNEQAWMSLQALLEATGKYDELRQMVTARLKQTVDPREVVRLNDRLGRVVWKLGNKPDEAVAYFKAALERDPRHKGALEALRDIHEAADRKAELVTALRRLVALQDDVQGVKKVRIRLAEVLAAMSRREESLDAARRALEVEPHDPADMGRVAQVFLTLRAYADAVRTLDLRATALAAAGQNEEAVGALFEIADLCKGALQKPENAAPAMVRILELDPGNRRAFDAAREMFRKQNDWRSWSEVTDRFLPHITAEDEKLAMLRELASIQENKLGQKDTAFLTACRALQQDAADDGVRQEVERLAEETGSHEEMAAVYEELADSLPRGAIAERLYLTLAKVHDERLDDPEAAETALRKILEFDPASPVALQTLSAMFARRGRDQEYLSSLEQQLEAAGTIEHRKAILAEIARIYDEKFQNPTEAASALQRSLDLEADGATFTALVALYRREKAWPEVAQTLARWRDLASTAEERAKLQADVAAIYEKEIADDEAAVEAYREALELDPHNHEALESLEHLYTKLDRPADLLAVYDRQREVSQDTRERISVLFKSAAIWEEKLNNPANAAEYVEQIFAEDPHNLQAIKTLERLRRSEEKWDALVQVLERHVVVSTSDEERAGLCVEMGDVFHQSLRQADKAVATYHRALELDPRSLAAMNALGQIYERSGNWPFALEMLAKEAELAGATPHAVELYHRMGKIQDEMLMDPSSARAAYEAALRIDPGYLPSLRALKQVFEQAQDWISYERVVAQEAKATDDSEAKARALVELGKHQLERKEDREGATRTFEEALKHVSDLLEAALPLADIYVATEDWARAERMLDIVVVKMAQKASDEQDEVMARALCGQLYRLGYVAEKRDRKDKALGSYEKAYQLDPTYLPALEGLGHLLVENKRYDEALKAYQTILVHHREELTDLEVVEIYWQIGEIHYGMEQFDRAQANFEKALTIDPGHEPSLKALILIADAAERWDHAAEFRESLVGVLEGEPKYQVAIELAMLAREKLSDPYRAIDAYQVAHRIHPESLEVMDALYVLLRETRQAQKAVEVLEKMLAEPALKKSPKLKQVWFALGEIARDELKDFDRALEAFNAALDADHRFVEAFSALEQLLAGQRQWKVLEESYVRMIQRIPKTTDTHGVRMMLFRALGDLYRQVLKDEDGALMAYQAVATGLPDDGPAQEAYAELASKKPGQEAKAIEAWRRALPSSTEPGKVVSAISALHAKRKEYDQAWLAAQAAHGFIGEVGEAEREILSKLGPYAKKREQATQTINDRNWRDQLFHPHARGHLTQIMALLFEQVGHVFAAPHSQFQINPKRHRIDVASAQVLQVHQFRYVARLLGMEAVELYSPYLVATLERLEKRSSDPAPEPLVGIEICHTHPVCLKVGGKFFPREHSESAQKELLYSLGRTFALLRPELAFAQRLPADKLEGLLQAAVSLSAPGFRPTVDRRVLDEMRRVLDRGLTPQAKAALAREIAAWMPHSAKQTIQAYLDGAELTAVRAGLFVAGEAEPVKRIVMGETGTAFRVPPRTKIRELMVFALSEDLHALRVAAGTSVEVAARAAAAR